MTPLFDGATKFFVSCRLRVDAREKLSGHVEPVITRSSQSTFTVGYDRDTIDGSRVRLLQSMRGSGTWTQRSYAPLGGAHHLALIYDGDDPDVQGAWLNGEFLATNSPTTSQIHGTGGRFELRAVGGAEHVVEGLVVGAGVVPTPEQVERMGAGDESVVAELIDAGGVVLWWSLQGEPGTEAGTPGDPGTTSIGSANLTFEHYSGEPALYVADMPYVRLTRFGEPTVMSTGRVIDVPVLYGSEDPVPANIVRHDPEKPPTFRINGGPSITPGRVLGTDGHHDALGCVLPQGVVVAKGDVVTWSVPAGAITTAGGANEAVVDAPVRNRVGATTYDPPAESKPFRVGVNITRPGPQYYAPYLLTKNVRYGCSEENYRPHLLGNYRPDGTRREPLGSTVVRSIPNVTKLDRVGYPVPLGAWLVQWLDKGAAGDDGERACEHTLRGGGNSVVLEEDDRYRFDLTRPDGSVEKSRVFVARRDESPVKLAAAIDASQTTIPVNQLTVTSIPSNSRGDVVLELDGETIIAKAVDKSASPPLLLECERGVRGTAQAHAEGADGVIASTSIGGEIYGRILGESGKTGPIHYSDLAIYPPGEWEPPAEPGPVPWRPADPMELSNEFRRWIVNKLGILRFMDSTSGGYGRTHEVDQLRDLDDESWVRNDRAPEPSVISVEQYEFDENSWCHFFYPGRNHETYPAELLSPLGPASAGDVEDVEVSSSGALMKGTRLLAGSERLRVISVSGTTARVERGADGTTPEARAAGPIEAGWRILMTQPPGGANPVYMRLKTDGPHDLHTFMRYATSVNSPTGDCNPLARRSMTLLDDLPASASALQLRVSADPEDWDYILPGLTIEVGSENLLVVDVDRGAGVLTVKERLSPKAHAANLAIRSYSNRTLCESEDGTSRRWQPGLDYGYELRVTGPDEFLVSRGGDGTEGRIVGVQALDPPVVVLNDAPGSSFPYELIAHAADEAGGWLWLNVAAFATDAHVLEIARRVREHFPAGRKVLVELVNEVWNFAFPHFGPFDEYARMVGLDGAIESWVERSGRIAELVRGVFAEEGRGDEVLLALPWQQANVGEALKAARKLGVAVDATGCAPYIRIRNTPENVAAWNAEDDATCCDLWAFNVARDAGPGTVRNRLEKDRDAAAEHRALTGQPLLMFHYEGGLDQAVPSNSGSGVLNPALDQSLERNRDIRNNPHWRWTELDSYSLIQRHSDGDGIAIFNNAQGPWRSNDDNPEDSLWGMNCFQGQLAGPGDGSEGGPDNRLNLYRKGLPESADPLTSPEAGKESVRWWAMMEYNAAFFADGDPNPDPGNGGGEGPDPGHGPDPEPGPTVTERRALPFPGPSRLRPRAGGPFRLRA